MHFSFIKKMACLLVASCLFGNCISDDPDTNPLAAFLDGESPLFIPIFSQAGLTHNGLQMEGQLLTTIHIANSSIYCTFEDLGLGTVMDALHLAHLRGVDVRVGLDEDHKNEAGYIALAAYLSTTGNFPRLQIGNSGDGEVYMNTCVADQTRVWASSAAPTPMDMYGKNAFSVYFQSDENGLARKFNVVLDVTTHGSFGSAKQRLNRRNHWLLGNLDIGVYFAPEEDPLEDFIIPRVAQASTSIFMYSSEFFANELDSGDNRESDDLAFEILQSPAPYKQVLVPWYGMQASDPDASGSTNSYNYLRTNSIATAVTGGGSPGGGMSFMILDGNLGTRQIYLSSHPYSKRTDSSHDGFTFIFEDAGIAGQLSTFFNSLRASSFAHPSTTGTDIISADGREIVISELNWAGAYNSSGASSSGEYVEFYNTTPTSINVSDWNFICNDGSDSTVFSFANLSTAAIIGPGEYFVVTRSSGNFLHRANAVETTWNTVDADINACRLEDGNATIIDRMGDGTFSFGQDELRFGLDDSTNKIRRSVERTDLSADGTARNNWHNNSHTVSTQNYNIEADYVANTFGTPGYANSAQSSNSYLLSGIIISEIYDSSAANDHFIELYNTNSYDIDLTAARAYIQRDSGCSIATGSITGKHALSGILPAGGRLAIGELSNSLGLVGVFADSFSITGTSYCVALTVGNVAITAYNSPNIIDFVPFVVGDSGGVAIGALSSNNSASRCPDPSGSFVLNTAFSANAVNVCP